MISLVRVATTSSLRFLFAIRKNGTRSVVKSSSGTGGEPRMVPFAQLVAFVRSINSSYGTGPDFRLVLGQSYVWLGLETSRELWPDIFRYIAGKLQTGPVIGG